MSHSNQYQSIDLFDWLSAPASTRSHELELLIKGRTSPLVIKGLVSGWPLVSLAEQGFEQQLAALEQTASPALIFKSEAPATSNGRFFYNDDFSDLNFSQTAEPLPKFLQRLSERHQLSEEQRSFCYMASTSLEYCFPELAASHSLPIGLPAPLISAWLGSQSVAATHFDVPDNIACNVFGRRTFTLFPPEQVGNLYIGPMHLTPAGQQISLVDVAAPDIEQFPRFKDAIDAGFQVTLEPGDALYIPSMWWHNVQAHDDLNLLINFWWTERPAFAGQPMDALKHAMLSIKTLPLEQRQHWQTLFEHYVFSDAAEALEHIPEQARKYLASLDEKTARELRAELIKALNK